MDFKKGIEHLRKSDKELAKIIEEYPEQEKQIEKIETVSAAGLFAEAISRVHDGESLSALFEF